jgi:hypothetical protein
MIGGWYAGQVLSAQSAIHIFGIHNFSLMFLLVKDGKFKRLVFVEKGNLAGCIFTNRNLGIAQGVGRAFSLDLVNDLLELEGQVFGDRAYLLPAQDLRQVFQACQGSVSIMLAAGWHGKALIEVS